jgi:hypothetical protein
MASFSVKEKDETSPSQPFLAGFAEPSFSELTEFGGFLFLQTLSWSLAIEPSAHAADSNGKIRYAQRMDYLAGLGRHHRDRFIKRTGR